MIDKCSTSIFFACYILRLGCVSVISSPCHIFSLFIPAALNGSTPYLIFGVDNKIYQQDISDIAGVTQYINKELYANNNGSVQIKGKKIYN